MAIYLVYDARLSQSTNYHSRQTFYGGSLVHNSIEDKFEQESTHIENNP
jgi:hypothetical protein